MTTAREQNLEAGRALYAAFVSRDMDGLRERIASDAVWNVGGDNAITGTYRGHEEIFGLFRRLQEMTGGTFKFVVHDLLASDDHVVVLAYVRGRRNGIDLDSPVVHMMHMRDGRLTEFWGFPGEAVFDEFWA